jgi:hypothetical protein
VRAAFDARTIRVYQAFPPEIAALAVEAQTFRPPFKRDRMTWIKPSFTWMMYRSDWGRKSGQERILGIDILRTGFEWALAHSSASQFATDMYASTEEWRTLFEQSPVRVQWDPERTLTLEPLSWRTIQVGLGGEAVEAYVDNWVAGIEDITQMVARIESLTADGDHVSAESLRPVEQPYPLSKEIARRVGCSTGQLM